MIRGSPREKNAVCRWWIVTTRLIIEFILSRESITHGSYRPTEMDHSLAFLSHESLTHAFTIYRQHTQLSHKRHVVPLSTSTTNLSLTWRPSGRWDGTLAWQLEQNFAYHCLLWRIDELERSTSYLLQIVAESFDLFKLKAFRIWMTRYYKMLPRDLLTFHRWQALVDALTPGWTRWAGPSSLLILLLHCLPHSLLTLNHHYKSLWWTII